MFFKHLHVTTDYLSDGTNEFPIPYENQGVEDDSVKVEVRGDRAVLSYITGDDDSGHLNPLEDGTANGAIYLSRERNCIWTDEGEVKKALFVTGRWSDEPDIDAGIIGKGGITPRDLAIKEYLDETPIIQLVDTWMEDRSMEFDDGESYEDCLANCRMEIEEWASSLEVVEEKAHKKFAEFWQDIVGPFAIPISYHSHYETSISVDSWDGDADNLPDGVWVADDLAIENILWDYVSRYSTEHLPIRLSYSEVEVRRGKDANGSSYTYPVWVPRFQVLSREGGVIKGGLRFPWAVREMLETYPELLPEIRKKAESYCEGVLKEVSSWASGDVWGCTTVYYKNVGSETEPEWVEESHDACWGYIGLDNAEAQSEEDFNSAVSRYLG